MCVVFIILINQNSMNMMMGKLFITCNMHTIYLIVDRFVVRMTVTAKQVWTDQG